jgi:putative NADH-flavin reductase
MPLRVTVFGGTGFLGRRVVRHLHDAGLVARVACRHPDAVPSLFSREVSGIEAVHTDVNDDGSVARALAGAWAALNTVSLYVERAKDTFHAVHVEAAKRIAVLAGQAGAETLVHISGIGAEYYERNNPAANQPVPPNIKATLKRALSLQNKSLTGIERLEAKVPDNEYAAEMFYTGRRVLTDQLNFINLYNERIDPLQKNKQFVFIDFPETYVDQIDRLVYPPNSSRPTGTDQTPRYAKSPSRSSSSLGVLRRQGAVKHKPC